jgi:hypothetical protein
MRSAHHEVAATVRRSLVHPFPLVAFAILLIGGLASAGETDLAADTIPAGTSISYKNWWQYSRFMPAGIQALFAGDHFCQLPTDIRARAPSPRR